MTINISTYFKADANFKPVMAEITALNKSLQAAQANMASFNMTGQAMGDIRRNFQQAVQAGGMWETQSMRLVDTQTKLTEAMRKQDVGLVQSIGQWKNLGQVIEHQTKLRQAVFTEWNRSSFGSIAGDLAIPTQALKDQNKLLDEAKVRFGVHREMLASVAHQTVNWGKNTQWAGRQMTVGLTVPIAALAVASGSAYKTMDEGLTRVTKVYDTVYDKQYKSWEIEKLRQDSMALTTELARKYGSAMEDTLAIEGELSAVGMNGQDLMKATAEVTRASMLGELDRNSAIQTAISLQNTFKLSTDELSDAFNYMNAVENATSLSMKDFTEAIPRAALPIQAMGGDVKDLGTMLVAMKAAGVDASEGANAIKAAFTRILTPAPQAKQMFFEKTGKDLMSIVESTKGELIPTFKAISKEMEGLDKLAKQQVMTKLFGTMQNARLQALMDGLVNSSMDGVDQVSRAVQVAMQSTEQLSETAGNEIAALQDSASGKWKRAMATFKAELASAGQPVLELATMLVNAITPVFEMFNSLGGTAKKAILIIAGLAMVVGPATMLVGLMANLAGTSAKFFLAISRLQNPFKLLTAEEVANTLAAKNNTGVVIQQADAYKVLALAVRDAQAAMNGQAATTVAGTAVGGLGGTAGTSRSNSERLARRRTGQSEGSRVVSAADAAELKKANDATGDLADNAERAGRGFANTTAGILGAAGATGILLAGSNSTLNNFGMMAVAASALIPVLGSINEKFKIMEKIQGRMSGGGKAGMAGKAGGMLGASTAFLMNPAVLGVAAAFGVALLAAKAYSNYLESLKKKQDEFNGIVKSTANIFGATYEDLKMPQANNKRGKEMQGYVKTLKELEKTQSEYIGEFRKMSEERARNEITLKAIEATQHGYTEDQVKKMVQTYAAARRGTKGTEYVDEVTVDVLGRVKMGDPDSQTVASAEASAGKIADAMNKVLGSKLFEGNKNRAIWEGATKQAGKNLSDMMIQSWTDAAGNENAMGAVIDAYSKSFKKDLLGKAKELGISDKDIAMLTDLTPNPNEPDEAYNWMQNQSAEVANLAQKLMAQAQAEKQVAQAAAENMGLSEKQIKNIKSMADLSNLLAKDYLSVKDAQKEYNDEIRYAQAGGRVLTEQERLAILNKWRLRSAIDEAKTSMQGFTVVESEAAKEAKKMNNALQDMKTLAPEVAKKMDAFLGAFKGNVDSGLGDLVDEALSQFDNATNAGEEGLRSQQDSADKFYDRKKKRYEDSYDRQAKALEDSYSRQEDAIKKKQAVEEAADKAREEMFQREKTRIERLAQMQNATIDFNSALKGGNLDEAAKIMVNQDAAVSGWAMDDAESATQSKSERNKAARDKQLETLKTQEEAEKASLQKRREAALQAIDAEREARKASLDAQLRNYESFRAQRRAQIEKELAMVKAQGARTVGEFKQRAAEIAKTVGSTTVSVNNQSLAWGRFAADRWAHYVKLTATQMSADENWGKVGQNIAEQISRGATGMNWGQFLTFMSTGKLPKGMEQDKNGKIVQKPNYPFKSESWSKKGLFHGGGRIGQVGGRNTTRNTLKSDEYQTVLQKGELVIDKNTAKGVMDKLPANAGPFPGLSTMMAGVAAMRVGQMMKVGMERMMQRKMEEMAMSGSEGFGLPAGMGMGSAGLIDTIMRGLRTQESGGNYKAINPTSGASGAYQYLRSTWNGYKGFGEARSAPPEIQDERVRSDLSKKFNQYKDWRKVVASHLYPAWAGDMSKWNQSPGYGNPTIWQYVRGVFTKSGIPLDSKGNFVNPAMQGPGPLGSGMIKPTRGGMSSGFGMRWGKLHAGVDFAAPSGTPIWAAMGGSVAQAGVNGGYGNFTKIYHGNYGGSPLFTSYAHQSRIGVQQGQRVSQGQVIGAVGNTGDSTGPHLHFEVRRGNTPQNPSGWINYGGGLKELPQLLNGGQVKYDNTIANLHKKETVLTAPLSADLKDGIKNLRDGGTTEYNLSIDARGSNLDENLLADKIFSKIRTLEARKGGSRTVR